MRLFVAVNLCGAEKQANASIDVMRSHMDHGGARQELLERFVLENGGE